MTFPPRFRRPKTGSFTCRSAPPFFTDPMSAKIRFINLKFPALCPCFRKDLKHYFMAEIVVPAVHRVAIYANNFSAGGRNGGRDIGADARDVKPLFPETLYAPPCPSARRGKTVFPHHFGRGRSERA